MAGCGAWPTNESTAHPTVRIVSPAGRATITTPPYLPGTVTVKVSISNFSLKGGTAQAGSGEVWVYADGQIVSSQASATAVFFLATGTYTLKAYLATNGKVVASSNPVVVTIAQAGAGTTTSANSSYQPASCSQTNKTNTTSGTQGQSVGSIALFSTDLPPCSQVNGLVAGPAGDLWFTYQLCPGACNGGGVGRITPTATIATYSTSGTPSYAFTQGAAGTLWFTYGGGIGRISAAGTVSLFTKGLPPNNFLGNLHQGLGGDLWFTDCISPGQGCGSGATGAIGRITPAGQISVFTQGLPGPVGGMVLGSDGNMWFTQSDGNLTAFGRITPSGQITMFSQGLPASAVQATSLQPGPGGDLWFNVLNANGQDSLGIGRITPSGTITIFNQGLPANSGIGNLLSGPAGAIWFPTCVQSTSSGGCVQGTGAIGRITPTGVITLFNQGLPAQGAPSDLILGQGGDMWFEYGQGGFAQGCGGPASWSAPIGVINPVGVITTFSQGLPANAGISPLTVGSGGSLWFSECVLDQGSCKGRLSLGSVSSTGVITLFDQGLPSAPVGASTGSPGQGSGTSPYSLTFLTQDSAGNLWFTYGDAIGEVTPSGAITVFSQGMPSGGYAFNFVMGRGGNLWFGYQLNNSWMLGRLML